MNEPMQAGFAEPDILVVAGRRGQTFDVAVVPARRLDGHFRRPPRNVVQLVVKPLIRTGSFNVARRPIRFAVVELPEQ